VTILDHLKRILVDAMVLYGGLTQKMTSKLITFGIDGLMCFLGCRIKVTISLKYLNIPFMIGDIA